MGNITCFNPFYDLARVKPLLSRFDPLFDMDDVLELTLPKKT